MHEHASAHWWEAGAALVLVGLLTFLRGRRQFHRIHSFRKTDQANDMDLILKVEGMTCCHCMASVKNALESVDQVQAPMPDLSSGLVTGDGVDKDALVAAVTRAGYRVLAS